MWSYSILSKFQVFEQLRLVSVLFCVTSDKASKPLGSKFYAVGQVSSVAHWPLILNNVMEIIL